MVCWRAGFFFLFCKKTVCKLVIYFLFYVFEHKLSLFLMVCLICPRLPVMYWNAPYCCVQIFACLKKKKAWTPDFCLKNTHCSFLFCFFCKTGCFSEATLLCKLSLSQNTFYSYDGGGWVSPPQYFTIPVVLKLHCLLLVVSALQWQHLISCCQTSSNFQFSPR